MNRKLYLLLFLLAFFTGCSQINVNDYIKDQWQVVMPFPLDGKNVVKRTSDYLVIKVPPLQKKQFQKLPIETFGYTPWKKLTGMGMDIYGFNIAGNYLYCDTLSPERCQIKKIFINQDKDEIIFVNINYSGY